MIAFDATLPAAERRDTVGTQLQFRHDQQSYDSWCQVFERACATESGESEHRASESLQSKEASIDSPPTSQVTEVSFENAPANTNGAHRALSPQTVAAHSQTHVAGKSNNETRLHAQASMASEPTIVDPEPTPTTDRPTMPRHILPKSHDASIQSSLESVTVLVQDGTVSIVVRDASVRDRAAIEAAFEVARDVSAGRSALRQLIVNGRTLYCRGEESPPDRGPIFIC